MLSCHMTILVPQLGSRRNHQREKDRMVQPLELWILLVGTLQLNMYCHAGDSSIQEILAYVLVHPYIISTASQHTLFTAEFILGWGRQLQQKRSCS